jgi:hypothetical protein
MQLKKIFLLLVYGFSFQFGFSQIGGESTYEFLNMSPSARVSALGGQNVSISDHDLSV